MPLTENEIQPKNRHCLQGLDGKYGRWDEILRERNGSYVPIQTNPEDDALQLHADGEIPGENKSNNIIRRSNRSIVKPNRYGSIPYTGNFWG